MPFIFPLIFSLLVFVIITIIGIKKLSIFPKISSVQVLFRERFLSGNSGVLFGSYRNVLEIVVTDQELWIRPFLPFVGIAAVLKGIHKIPINAILGIETRGKETTIYFNNPKGEEICFSIYFSKPNNFIQVIEQLNTSVKVIAVH